MPAHLGILAGKFLEPAAGMHVLMELGLYLAGEAHIEVVEHLDVEEKHGGLGQLGRDRVEEDFRAVVLIGQGLALARLGGLDAQGQDVGAVAEEDGFAAWRWSASHHIRWGCGTRTEIGLTFC